MVLPELCEGTLQQAGAENERAKDEREAGAEPKFATGGLIGIVFTHGAVKWR